MTERLHVRLLDQFQTKLDLSGWSRRLTELTRPANQTPGYIGERAGGIDADRRREVCAIEYIETLLPLTNSSRPSMRVAGGEVYRTRDTKLGRELAIKVLSDAFV